MAKANQSQNTELVPVNTGGTDKKQKQIWMSRAMFVMGTCLLMAMVLIGGASATEMNWTVMVDMLDGLTTIMPSFGNLIFAIVPILMVVMVVGFATGLLDSILEGITGMFSRIGRR